MTVHDDEIASVIAQTTKRPVEQVLASRDLFGEGILDSFGMLDMLAALEAKFGVAITNEDLTWQNFHSVEKITTLFKKSHRH